MLKDCQREWRFNNKGLNGKGTRGMLFNPLAEIEIRMLVPIMVDLSKVMMDPKGRPEGHHDEEQDDQGY
jgi:hypothetical protein